MISLLTLTDGVIHDEGVLCLWLNKMPYRKRPDD